MNSLEMIDNSSPEPDEPTRALPSLPDKLPEMNSEVPAIDIEGIEEPIGDEKTAGVD